jgi:hypothetical protein
MSSDVSAAQQGVNPDVLWRVVGKEALLLNTVSGYYFSLNPVATAIWVRLTSGESPEQVSEGIASAYSIGVELARQDIDELITEMKDAGIWR